MVQKINDYFAIFRDDTFPFLGGGNKARKMMALHKSIVANAYTAIVTTGGIQSNHCRATVLYCKKYNVKCTLVLHGSEERFKKQSGNARIIRNSNANIIFSKPSNIGKNMDDAINKYKIEGHKPYYLYGGGHTLDGGNIYIDTIEEIIKSKFIPDYIFIASGSGTTQAGILAGIAKYKLTTKVIGISVGRQKEVAEKNVTDFYKKLCAENNIMETNQIIRVSDTYSCGGYEKFNSCIENIANDSLTNYGFALDTTYTGKAYYGMREIIKKEELKGNILFWYTGGIYNYLS